MLVREDPLPDWISVREAAEHTGYTERHIRYLLGQGKVEGRKFGRDWFTTKEALQKYLATNPRPGPKPSKETES
jgi:excisionase family DNA binding protein